MDKRRKPTDPAAEADQRAAFYAQVAAGELDLAAAVKAMRSLSRLTQPEFAAKRGISVQALRQIESGTGNPTVRTLDSIASIFGLTVGFVPRVRREARATQKRGTD